MRLIQKDEKPIILGKNILFASKANRYRTIFGCLVLVLVIIVCVIIPLCFYKFEFPCKHKQCELRSMKKISSQKNPPSSPSPSPEPPPQWSPLPPPPPPTIRHTLNGPVEGIEETTALGQKFYSFRGIPFAEPPITGIDPYTGEQVDRRFKAPVPFKRNWTEPLKVHDFKEFCQPTDSKLPSDIQHYKTSEDCLFMNVFVPSGGAKKKPVFVYIHGGGPGGGITDLLMTPDFFLAHDNVVVYLTFRVDIYGFVNLGIGEYTGNMALKDQQLGMKWVYDNIEFFSGNKSQILLFGDSSGSTWVHGHVLNAESRKYFTRVYLVSGTVSPRNLHRDSQLPYVRRCLQFNGSNAELLDYMKTAPSATLSKCHYMDRILHIEGPNAIAPFITKTPDEIYDSDEAPVIDAMYTFASQESVKIFPGITHWTFPLHKDWRRSKLALPYENFNGWSHPNEIKKAMAILKKAYYPTNSSDIDEVKRVNIAYMSDVMVSDDILRSVVRQANANTKSSDKSRHKNTYLVRVSMHSDLNAMETQYKKNYTGTAHSDDLCYMFYCRFLDEFNVTEPHIIKRDHVYDMIMRNVQRMSNFARYGDPSTKGDTPFKSSQSSNEIYCHEVSNEPKIRITTDIKQQLKYDVWRKIDDIYKNRSTKKRPI